MGFIRKDQLLWFEMLSNKHLECGMVVLVSLNGCPSNLRLHRIMPTGKLIVPTHLFSSETTPPQGPRNCLDRNMDIADLQQLFLELLEYHIRLSLDTSFQKLFLC